MKRASTAWPVLKRYDQDHLLRIAMPIGGIGTGSVSLGGRGNLQDWEVVNRPAKGFAPIPAFFALRVKPRSGPAVARVLEGPIDPSEYAGANGCAVPGHGLPRFQGCRFEAAYPLGQVILSDSEVPVSVRLQAFNPLIPGDADDSGIPIAILRYVLTNRTSGVVAASVCGNVQNFIGLDGAGGSARGNDNEFRRSPGLQGLLMRSRGVDPVAEQFGTLALATTARSGVSYRQAWQDSGWNDPQVDFWDDFTSDGRLEDRDIGRAQAPVASLAVSLTLPPRDTRAITFLIAWHFPNRRTWSPRKATAAPATTAGTGNSSSPQVGGADPDIIGNYYTTRYSDAWDAAVQTAPRLMELERQTLAFVRSFVGCDLPLAVKDAALSNLSTLRTQTCFRTPDGHFFGFEGCGDHAGSCEGNCTHVWLYEQATPMLFAPLARSMRRIEFAHCTEPSGRMSFRVHLPLSRATHFPLAAADGQMGCLVKLYRDWQLSGDDNLLRELWPHARRALEFCWMPGGWDADRDGVMEGCQHNTMDVEYYGPNPQASAIYLAALRASEQMARYLGEEEFAVICRGLFERGSRWIDRHLFNGDYYEPQFRRIDPATIPAALYDRGGEGPGSADLQIGRGCELTQLLGQQLADVAGLGPLLDRRKIAKALRSMLKYNFRSHLRGHCSELRSFALDGEAGLLMCTWPRGGRPKRPYRYASELWSGVEYMVAAMLFDAGMTAQGLRVVSAVRARHDGAKRNPFDEPECGHHYARAMSSWALVLSLSGFRYSAVDQSMTFAASGRPVRWFWSTGDAWGVCVQKPIRGGTALRLSVLWGKITVRRICLKDKAELLLEKPRRISAGRSEKFVISNDTAGSQTIRRRSLARRR